MIYFFYALAGSIVVGIAFLARFFLRRRRFTITGIVHKGNSQGAKLGAPTANLDLALAKDLPKGLYTCTVTIGTSTAPYRGLLYYGHNSLSEKDCLEVHLLDFKGDLYGEKISVITTRFLRRQKKFKTPEALKKQIEEDIENALQI
jgi:riboflavin kinase/FMN adenylyltransferase